MGTVDMGCGVSESEGSSARFRKYVWLITSHREAPVSHTSCYGKRKDVNDCLIVRNLENRTERKDYYDLLGAEPHTNIWREPNSQSTEPRGRETFASECCDQI